VYELVKTLIPVPGSQDLFQEVQKFGDSKIQAAIDASLAKLGDKSGVVFRFDADPGGINAAIAGKFAGQWSLVVAYHHEWKDKTWGYAGLEVARVW